MNITPDKLQVYPRGFLGRPLPTVVAKKETPFSVEKNKKQFDLSLLDVPDRKRVGHPLVEQLFSKYLRAEGNINSSAFREQVFIAALTLFGGRDFHFWYQAQKASPLFGDYQKRFLEDTILYLQTGKRELSLVSWNALITVSADPDQPGPESKFVNEFFGESIVGEGQRTAKNRDIVDILQMWWSKPAGVGDLLYTLHILFGNIL